MDHSQSRLSLAQQWLLIATVALVPLLTVAAYATWSLYQQMHKQRLIVQRVDLVSHVQSAVVDQMRELERSVRQYRLLRDPRFLDLYQQKRESFRQAKIELKMLVPEIQTFEASAVAQQQHPLERAVLLLDGVSEVIDDLRLEDLEENAFSDVLTRINQARVEFDEEIAVHTHRLTDEVERDLQAILWRLSLMGLITLPLTLVLMSLAFVQMISPVRRLSMAIRNLGQGDWQTPIYVHGPRDLQALGERLEWMRGQLLATDRQKRAFLRHISHELKTPLSAIMEAGSLLEDKIPGPLTEQQHKVLQILVQNANDLRDLIQQLLNYNVITYSFKSLKSEVDMCALCVKITERLDQHSYAHRVTWDIAQSPETIPADPELLEMMLTNLLSNAFHYSPSDSVIKVRWGRESKECWISVEDQGPGIAQEEQARIFELFAQGSARRHGPLQGSGVGLAIVKESINNLGGSVGIESTPGEGSRFTLRFPLS